MAHFQNVPRSINSNQCHPRSHKKNQLSTTSLSLTGNHINIQRSFVTNFMATNKTDFGPFNFNVFRHGNDGVTYDRLPVGRRWWVLEKGFSSTNAMVFLFFFLTIVFCYSISAGWITFSYPKYSTSSSQKSISLSSLKPLPAPPPPLKSITNLTLEWNSTQNSELSINLPHPLLPSKPKPKPKENLLPCNPKGPNQTCLHNYPTNHTPANPSRPSTCPDHFRWIHEDLKPWKATGVTRKMVEGARRTAHFRLVILDGRVYVEKFRKSLQTRDKFTLWGILQLLRWYPGRLPDLELMFDCDDRPVIASKTFSRPNSGPPPLFRYCSDPWSLDIVFPDWSFWGWAETNIKPWRKTSRYIQEGNQRIKWRDRVPYAYWRGNPRVAPWRADLLKCNVSNQTDWNTRLYIQNWKDEAKLGYKESNLEDQCTHRYKIYIEGWAWSVSEKYILACDSMTLLVKPRYHTFFNRGMLPLEHYWPIKDNDKCRSLKFAVEWGNNHTDKAQMIGQAGSRYIHEDMKMERVYDYMFHLLNEYSKLLKFKPKVPPKANELCSQTMPCQSEGIWRKFMEESLEKSPSEQVPCNMPPPYDTLGLKTFLDRKANLTRQVDMWENEYWAKLNPKRIK